MYLSLGTRPAGYSYVTVLNLCVLMNERQYLFYTPE